MRKGLLGHIRWVDQVLVCYGKSEDEMPGLSVEEMRDAWRLALFHYAPPHASTDEKEEPVTGIFPR